MNQVYGNFRAIARRTIMVVLVLYWAVIFAGTHASAPPNPGIDFNDKILHFSAYTGLAFLLSWAILRLRPTWKGVLVALMVVAIYGIADELSQMFVPTRSADIGDWTADVLGGLFGIALYYLSNRLVLSWLVRPYRAASLVRNDAAQDAA